GEVERQRQAFEQVAAAHGIDAIWCVKVETGIDGVAWLEHAAAEAQTPDEPEPPRGEEVDAIFEHEAEVLYSAPDAPPSEPPPDPPPATEDDADGDDDLEPADGVALESRWRNGAPPLED